MTIDEHLAEWYENRVIPEKWKEIGLNRLLICNDCPKIINEVVDDKNTSTCSECGCSISKRIFSPQFNSCPLLKFKESDLIHYPTRQKVKTTLI
jgi:hypothetical protein